MKKLLIASTLALCSLGANASVISAGGISWDDTGLDPTGVSAQVNFQQWFTNVSTTTMDNGTAGDTSDDYQVITDDDAVAGGAGVELVGLGEFTTFSDGRMPASFCDSGACELTFAFGGLVVSGFDGVTPLFDVSSAWFNIYIDETPDFVDATVDNTALTLGAHEHYVEAQNGTLFAALEFDSFILDGTIIGGESESTLSIRTVDGLGLSDVQDAWDYSSFLSDLGFTAGATIQAGDLYSRDGNGQAIGEPVSAPTSIALFGIGLIGLSLASRRKKAE
jgi:hypothetical protein